MTKIGWQRQCWTLQTLSISARKILVCGLVECNTQNIRTEKTVSLHSNTAWVGFECWHFSKFIWYDSHQLTKSLLLRPKRVDRVSLTRQFFTMLFTISTLDWPIISTIEPCGKCWNQKDKVHGQLMLHLINIRKTQINTWLFTYQSSIAKEFRVVKCCIYLVISKNCTTIPSCIVVS